MASPDDTQAQPDYPVTILEFEFEGDTYTLYAEAEDDEFTNDRFHAIKHGTIDYEIYTGTLFQKGEK